jgi:DNA-binding IclR family transcriptional regulator
VPPEYAVPALDKALDIIEVLAVRDTGLSQLEIAQAVERSPSQIFRVLSTLERRGYLHRNRQSGLYSLSLRLFDFVNRQEPVRMLSAAAIGPMRRLADAVGQSCNLSVLDIDRVRVIAQAESPGDFGFRVRVGAEFSLADTATGAVLRAFGGGAGSTPPGPVDVLFGSSEGEGGGEGVGAGRSDARGDGAAAAAAAADGDAAADVGAEADSDAAGTSDRIRTRGYLERADPLQPSITDLVFPVLTRDGRAVAALTVPYVSTSFSAVSSATVITAAAATATEISTNLGF